MEPLFSINDWPGCRGDCRQGRALCPCPAECDPDGPPMTRAWYVIVIAAGVLCWAAVGALIWLAMGVAL